jgi:hypothetical protein
MLTQFKESGPLLDDARVFAIIDVLNVALFGLALGPHSAHMFTCLQGIGCPPLFLAPLHNPLHLGATQHQDRNGQADSVGPDTDASRTKLSGHVLSVL